MPPAETRLLPSAPVGKDKPQQKFPVWWQKRESGSSFASRGKARDDTQFPTFWMPAEQSRGLCSIIQGTATALDHSLQTVNPWVHPRGSSLPWGKIPKMGKSEVLAEMGGSQQPPSREGIWGLGCPHGAEHPLLTLRSCSGDRRMRAMSSATLP